MILRLLLLAFVAFGLQAQNVVTIIPDAAHPGKLKFRELLVNGVNVVTLQAPDTLTADVPIKLPDNVGVAGDCLMNGATPGELTFSTCGAGGLPVSDAIPIVHAAADVTALMRFDATLITTGTTVVLGIPDHSMILAGTDIDNFFTANQTFRDILCYVDNGCNIGTSPVRFNTLATHNVDSAPPGDTSAYTLVNHLAIVDHLNGGAGIGTPSAFWDFLASAQGIGTSALQIRDNSGDVVFDLVRALGGLVFQEARLDMNLVPSDASLSGVQSNWSLGIPTKKWNQLYISGLNVNTVFTDLIPTGTLNIGNSSNRWNGFFQDINIAGTCTGPGCGGTPPFSDLGALVKNATDATKLVRIDASPVSTGTTRVLSPQDTNYILAGINIAQTFSANQTFHDVLCFNDNGCNAGSFSTRFNTVFAYNIDAAPVGTIGNYMKTRQLAVVDFFGGAAYWDMIVGVTVGATSSLTLRDNGGASVVKFSRFALGSADNTTTFYTDVVPSATGSLFMGRTARRWNGNFQDIDISGSFTCSGTGCPGLPPFGDATALLYNSAAPSKFIRFDLSPLSIGATRVLQPQDSNYIIAGINLAQTFTVNQTFHDVLCFVNNGCNIGSIATRFNTVFAYNFDGAPSGTTGNYVMTRQLAIADRNGGTAYWDMLTTAQTSLNADWTLRDNAGSPVLKFTRYFGGVAANDGTFYTSVVPNTTAQGLGTTTKRWTAYLQDLDIAGTCTGCLSGVLTANNFWTGTNTFYNNTHELIADGGNSAFLFASSYGAGFNGFIGRAAGGSASFPSASVTDQQLAALGGRGRTGGGTGSWTTGNSATISFSAAENWAGGGNGSYIQLGTTPIGSTSRVTKLRINSGTAAVPLDYQTIQSGGGFYSSMGFTADQAMYPRALGSCSSLNASNSVYGGLGYQSGSTYCYWNSSTLSWNTVNFAASAGGVTNVFGSAPITSSGGATPTIACPTCLTPTTSAPTISGSTWVFSNAIRATTGVDTTGSFSTLNGAITTSLLSSGGLSIYNPSTGAFIAGISSFTGAFTGPSGSPGTSTILSCGVGLAIKTLNISGGIVVSATCGAP